MKRKHALQVRQIYFGKGPGGPRSHPGEDRWVLMGAFTPEKIWTKVFHFLNRNFANFTVVRIKGYIARVMKDTYMR
jgi:hypothetical protein